MYTITTAADSITIEPSIESLVVTYNGKFWTVDDVAGDYIESFESQDDAVQLVQQIIKGMGE